MTLNSSTNSESMPMTFPIKPNSSCPHGIHVEASVHFLIDRTKWGLCCSSSVQHFLFLSSTVTVKRVNRFSQHVWRPNTSRLSRQHQRRNHRVRSHHSHHPWAKTVIANMLQICIVGKTLLDRCEYNQGLQMRGCDAEEVLSHWSLLRREWLLCTLPDAQVISIVTFSNRSRIWSDFICHAENKMVADTKS